MGRSTFSPWRDLAIIFRPHPAPASHSPIHAPTYVLELWMRPHVIDADEPPAAESRDDVWDSYPLRSYASVQEADAHRRSMCATLADPRLLDAWAALLSTAEPEETEFVEVAP
jgi:hypothetical protein